MISYFVRSVSQISNWWDVDKIFQIIGNIDIKTLKMMVYILLLVLVILVGLDLMELQEQITRMKNKVDSLETELTSIKSNTRWIFVCLTLEHRVKGKTRKLCYSRYSLIVSNYLWNNLSQRCSMLIVLVDLDFEKYYLICSIQDSRLKACSKNVRVTTIFE